MRRAMKNPKKSNDFRYFYCMKQRVYIDTSVFGGYFDEEFSEH